jgi:hypothetical protein
MCMWLSPFAARPIQRCWRTQLSSSRTFLCKWGGAPSSCRMLSFNKFLKLHQSFVNTCIYIYIYIYIYVCVYIYIYISILIYIYIYIFMNGPVFHMCKSVLHSTTIEVAYSPYRFCSTNCACIFTSMDLIEDCKSYLRVPDISRFSGIYSGSYSDCGLLGCDTV